MRINLRKFLKLTLSILLSFPPLASAQSQTVIRGCVFDAENKPLPHASIYIAAPEKPASMIKGMVSDANGKFALQAEKDKSYILKVSYMGYKDHSVRVKTDSTTVNVGDIFLETNTQKLAEVVVRPPLQVTADKIVYNFENDPDRETASLHDMIEKMPLVSIGPRGEIIVDSPEKI